ncbi:hypothetical protein KBB48_03435 [Candidatus Shapirobacteria bacterium]|nr:hypothetical protein [Candidatus Shapirobacteria bacterium]
MRRGAFTLIEIVVMVGILGLIMGMLSLSLGFSFKLKDSTGSMEAVTTKGNFVMGELKKNVLDAKAETISCGTTNVWSTYVAFDTRNGGNTRLSCGGSTGAQIASQSANGTFILVQDSNVSLLNCGLVKCNYLGQNLQSLTFSFTLQGSNANLGTQVTASFSQTFSPRF